MDKKALKKSKEELQKYLKFKKREFTIPPKKTKVPSRENQSTKTFDFLLKILKILI